MSTEIIECEPHETFCVLRLNRPDVHNVVNEAVVSRLEAILDELEPRARIRSLILTGTGSETFCAGGDLRFFADLASSAAGRAMSRRVQACLQRFTSGRFFSIAAVNGQVLGGGCEILTALHFRIAASHANFSYRQAPNGLITGWGGGARLFRLVGRAQALRLLLTAARIDAGEALRIGLVDQVVPPEKLLDAAMDLARMIGEQPPEPVRAFLELASLQDQGETDAALERETELFGELWTGEVFRRVVERFSKRGGSAQSETPPSASSSASTS